MKCLLNKKWIEETKSGSASFMFGTEKKSFIVKKYPFVPIKNLQLLSFLSLFLLVVSTAEAGPREQAQRLHDRLAGVPPTLSVLNAMTDDINGVGGDTAIDAAYTAMDNDSFYNETLVNFITPWTNEGQTVFAPLNDYTATVIGVIRDDRDFRTILSGDILYTGDAGLGLPAHSNDNNDHYEALQDSGLPLRTALIDEANAVQSSITGLPSAATAGVMTSRAAARAFFSAGTNRAMLRFTLMNHLCNDLEQLKDATLSPDRIRQDVTRSPGGDSRLFMNGCVSCHSGMDPLAQAFAYYNYSGAEDSDVGQLLYNDIGQLDSETGTRVQAKYHINENNFPAGFVTPDDSWDNYWRSGHNRALGWDSGLTGSGNGAKSLGFELAQSEAFAVCQVEKVFKATCFREPQDAADRAQVSSMVSSFQTNGYQLKRVFAESAVYCMGD